MRKTVGFDVEASSKDPLTARLASIQIYHPDRDEVEIIRIGFTRVDNQPIEEVREYINSLDVVGFHLSYDLTICARYGLFPKPVGDAEILFNQGPHSPWHPKDDRSLKTLSAQYLGTPMLRYDEVVPEGVPFNDLDPDAEVVKQYMEQDPKQALLLYVKLMGETPELFNAHKDEMAALQVFTQMYVQGMRVDEEGMANLQHHMELEHKSILDELFALCGFEFKPNSAAAMPRVFEVRGIPDPGTKSPTGRPSYTAELLEDYRADRAFDLILQSRAMIYAIPRVQSLVLDHIKGGRLHPNYRQVSVSGSARVYTQGPSTGSLSRAARRFILPDPGKKFIYADWSAAELAAAAQEADERAITEPYFAGRDHMREMAARHLGKEVDQVANDEREDQKVVTYASLYGSEGPAVEARLKCSSSHARAVVEGFWNMLPCLALHRDNVIEEASKARYVTTMTGFRRYLPDLASPVKGLREKAKRKAWNTRFQSGVACLFKRTIARAPGLLPAGCRVVTGVFDSFLFEVPQDMTVEEFRPVVEELSTIQVGDKTFKFRFSMKEGKSWGEAQFGA